MSSPRRTHPQRKSVHPRLEELESRIVPTLFNVDSVGGLLSAIQSADTNSDASNTDCDGARHLHAEGQYHQ